MTMTDDANSSPDPRHQQAFEIYWSLGQKRSYARVAKRVGVSTSTIKLWSKQQRWRQRILEREVQQSRQLADTVQSGPDPESDRNLKIVRVAILRIAKAIAEGRVRSTMGDLDRMVRLEERLTGVHGISPKLLAKAAAYLQDLERMPMERLMADVRRSALELGVIRPDGTVVPEEDLPDPPIDA